MVVVILVTTLFTHKQGEIIERQDAIHDALVVAKVDSYKFLHPSFFFFEYVICFH
jgi:hypothetical protein